MSIAVLSDIHGNFEAFQVCVQYALERGIKTFIFLGDYLGEFAFPQRTMEFIYQLKDSYECIFIKGNKEDYWLNYRKFGECGWKEYDSTTGSLYYSYNNLTDKDLEFYSSMDSMKELRFGDMEPIMICHGSPRKVNAYGQIFLKYSGKKRMKVILEKKIYKAMIACIIPRKNHFQYAWSRKKYMIVLG